LSIEFQGEVGRTPLQGEMECLLADRFSGRRCGTWSVSPVGGCVELM